MSAKVCDCVDIRLLKVLNLYLFTSYDQAFLSALSQHNFSSQLST